MQCVTISYHPVIQGNIRRFWQQGISDFQLPEAELRAIGVTNPAGLNRRMFPMNKRVVYYFTTMRLIGLEVVSCAWNFVTTPLANRMVRALATISLLLLLIFSFEYRHYVFHYCCAQSDPDVNRKCRVFLWCSKIAITFKRLFLKNIMINVSHGCCVLYY